jgi:hypothetical protein
MSLEKDIKNILLEVGQGIKIHTIDAKNTAIEIDYDKHTIKLLELFKKYLEDNHEILDKLGSDYDENGIAYWEKNDK